MKTLLLRTLVQRFGVLLSLLFAGNLLAVDRDFAQKVQPFLNKHCVRCHGPEREEGDVRVDQISWDLDDLTRVDDLQNILDEIVVDSMPPPGEPRPGAQVLKQISEVLSKHVTAAKKKHSSGGGKPVRRLTRTEYVNTLYDLLGVRVDSKELPEDGVVGSFDTDAAELYTTDMHIERCLEVARDAARKFIAGRNGDTVHNQFFQTVQKRYGDQVPDAAAKELILDFTILMNRGRRPDRKLASDLFDNFRLGRQQGQTFWNAMVEPMALSMCTMEAMFHFESRGSTKTSRYVSPVEMVNRVSYFLWRSAPDAELIRLALSKEWYKPEVRVEQFRRMVTDEKFDRFLRDFTTQWLELDRQDEIAVDDRLFPKFDTDVKKSMKEETIQFVSHVIRKNLPLRNLIDSDFMMTNNLLAKHYGLPEVNGDELRVVPVPEGAKRGGILTHAGILMQTGTGDRTSIVERGAFVLRKLLNAPPGTPPPLVDELPSTGQAVAKMTGAQLVAMHRQAPQCASCHNKIDSIGTGLEELDAVGLFRTVDTRVNPNLAKLNKKQRRNPKNLTINLPLESKGRVLGRNFTGVEGLKKALGSKDHLLAEAYIEALLSMANGRQSGVADKSIVQDIIQRAKASDLPALSILVAVLRSDVFRAY